ncbi:helix-turn-helix domain-containing protein [Streptomyces sp. NPDC053794]
MTHSAHSKGRPPAGSPHEPLATTRLTETQVLVYAALTERETPVTTAEIAHASAVAKTTALRVLNTLADDGLVVQTRPVSGRTGPSPMCWELAPHITGKGEMVSSAAAVHGYATAEQAELGLVGARAAVYTHLAEQTSPVTAADIARATGYARPTVWNALNHLEHRGLAARTYVQLSGHGKTPDRWALTDHLPCDGAPLRSST